MITLKQMKYLLLSKVSWIFSFAMEKSTLNEGEMFVVPKGVEHKPVAENECHILLIEPAGYSQYW